MSPGAPGIGELALTEIRGVTRKNSMRICETASAPRQPGVWEGEADAKCAHGAPGFFLVRLKRGNEKKSFRSGGRGMEGGGERGEREADTY